VLNAAPAAPGVRVGAAEPRGRLFGDHDLPRLG